MEDQEKPNRKVAIRSLIITLLVVLVLVAVITRSMENTQRFIRDSGWIGLILSIAIYGLLGATPIPSEPLTIFVSTIFGPITATLVAGLGNLLAAMVEYYIGERIGNAASFIRQKEKLPLGLGKLPVNSWPFLMAARMLPGYGPKFVSVIAGVYRVSIWRYIWTAAIPTFLGAAIFAYGGFSLFDLARHTIFK